jgi:CheY-like chemotaxis protein
MAKLLVVDDESNLRLVVQKEMSRQDTSRNAVTAKRRGNRLEHEDFDVVLCDINMPRLDGIGLLRRLREKSQNPPK